MFRKLYALILALTFIFAPLSCFAQGMEFASSSKEPIEVTAKDGIELHQKESVIIARKDAIASRGKDTLKADTISAFYRKAPNGKTEIYKLQAEGKVIMTSQTDKATGDKATYTIDDSLLLLTGKPASLKTKTEKVTADTLEYWQDKQIVSAKGKAKIIRENGTVESDNLSAVFKKTANDKLEIDVMNAFGNVVISTPNETAFGDKASYTPKTGIAVLLGNVKLTKDGNYLEGEKAVVNMTTGISKLFSGKEENNSRVKGVFLPDSLKDSTSKDKDNKTE